MKETQMKRRGREITFYDFEAEEGDDLPEIGSNTDNVVPFAKEPKQ